MSDRINGIPRPVVRKSDVVVAEVLDRRGKVQDQIYKVEG